MEGIYFDMDGTIADFYGVENWLEYLKAEDTKPYREAKPLLNLNQLARQLNKLQREGHILGIISWTSKNGTPQFDAAVTVEKMKWLQKHMPSVHWDVIHIVKYGTNKSIFGEGILFDDEKQNRMDWMRADAENWAFNEKEILTVLKGIL